MTSLWLFFLGASVWPLILAAVSLRKATRTLASWAFAAGMTLLAADNLLAAASYASAKTEFILNLERLRFLLVALLPLAWLPFSVCYSRGNHREFLSRWRYVLIGTALVPVFAAIMLPRAFNVLGAVSSFGEPSELHLFWPGRVIHLAVVIAAVLVLMNLERTFTASVGTMRWRIKFMVLGVGLIVAVRFYTSTQSFLYSIPDSSAAALHAVALCLACGLISVSFLRANVSGVEVYPSLAFLQSSLTVLLAGSYLMIVGVLAHLSELTGGNVASPLRSLLILVSLVGLGLVLFSERLRFLGRRFVSRHFRRSLYDYRTIWRTFTERTSSVPDAPSYCRELANVVSETLQVFSVSAWLIDDNRGKLVLVASTSLTQNPSDKSPQAELDAGPLVESFGSRSDPLALAQCQGTWVEELKRCNPAQFRANLGLICVPLVGKGQLLGLLIVGDRVNSVPLSVEDLELLKCIGDQAVSGLLNLQLAQRLLRAREMEAFQTMAAFFVHDLKNTVSSLSLMLQNLPTQMENPEFRQDAFRAVSKAVAKINDLISRLSLLREKVKMSRTETDLAVVIQSAIETASLPPSIRLVTDLKPAPGALVDPEQIQKVAINLLINAQQAIGDRGEIQMGTSSDNGWAILSVKDSGCGMTAEFLSRSLFRPFQTTKKNGIGIGMFHCKTIVEAHQGRIEVESQPGVGTTFRVLLPIAGRVA